MVQLEIETDQIQYATLHYISLLQYAIIHNFVMAP